MHPLPAFLILAYVAWALWEAANAPEMPACEEHQEEEEIHYYQDYNNEN